MKIIIKTIKRAGYFPIYEMWTETGEKIENVFSVEVSTNYSSLALQENLESVEFVIKATDIVNTVE